MNDIFGKPLENLFIPPILRGGSSTNYSLQEILMGVSGSGQTGIIPHYSSILSAVAAFIAFCYIVKGGYAMFTAFGDEAKYATAKKTLQYAVIGFIISISAIFLIKFFTGLLGYTG